MSEVDMSRSPRVVILEDDYLIAEDLRALSEEFGAEVLDVFYKAQGAAENILQLNPDFVLMDVRLGGKRDGVDVAQAIHDRTETIRVIFITGSNEPPTIKRINEDHPHRILIKPISPAQLQEALQS